MSESMEKLKQLTQLIVSSIEKIEIDEYGFPVFSKTADEKLVQAVALIKEAQYISATNSAADIAKLIADAEAMLIAAGLKSDADLVVLEEKNAQINQLQQDLKVATDRVTDLEDGK